MPSLDYLHVDVFAPRPYAGNSLPVFLDSRGLDARQMQAITQELRHFEAIFLTPTDDPHSVRARVFDMFEELPFAGHPVIGAAAALQATSGEREARTWTFELLDRSVSVEVHATEAGYHGLLDQGAAQFLGATTDRPVVAAAFGLSAEDLDPAVPLAIVSTGLRYLIIPVRPGVLSRAAIGADITAMVQGVGAQYAVLFDEAALEVRHWNNDGLVEDIATGSAAGTIGAYRLRHGRAQPGEGFMLNQGRFTGRPSRLFVESHGSAEEVHSVKVGGEVAIVGRGEVTALP